jgi:hypothetical protein
MHNVTKEIVAIKQINLEDSEEDISEIQQEIALLSQCDSEYITKYYGSCVKGFKLWIGKADWTTWTRAHNGLNCLRGHGGDPIEQEN